MAGLVPAISLRKASPCPTKRDHRHKAGDDEGIPMTKAPLTFLFNDDGKVPNNPTLPALIYKGAVDVTGDAAQAIETLFARNGWGHGQWRNGIYPFVHYHSMIHEALGIAQGRARVQFGGPGGET